MKKHLLSVLFLMVTCTLWGTAVTVMVNHSTHNDLAVTAHIPYVSVVDTITDVNVTVCDENLPYSFNNQLITDPGTYWDTLIAVNGGDSIVRLNLFVKCCQASANTPDFADVCAEAPLLCADYIDATPFHLDNSIAETPGNLASAFCYPIEHSRWLRFAACDQEVSLEITVQNCSGTNPALAGVEIALFSGINCLNFNRIGDCYQTNWLQTQTLQFDGLLPGTEYYLLADGINTEACDFTLKVLSGINTGVPDDYVSVGAATDGMINGDKDVCPGEVVIYTLTPPTCKATLPEYDCPIPDGACGICGTVLSLDSVIYKWHIPPCARFLGDSTGLEIQVIYDQCVFFTDTVVIQQIWVEVVPVYADTFFIQKDTLVFCDCYGGSLTCGIIPPCDVRIHFDVEDIFLTIPCVGPPPEFMGTTYPVPGTYTQPDVSNCLLYIIHVDQETGPGLTVASSIAFITCIFHPLLTASSPGQITWIPPFGFPENGSSIQAYDPGVYTAIATDANGCTSSATTTVFSHQFIPVAQAGPDQVLCAEETPVQLHAIPGGPNWAYHWSNGATGANIIVNQTVGIATYHVTVSDLTNGCTDTDHVTITVEPPIVTVFPSISICQGDCFMLGGELICPTGSNSPAQVVLSSYTGCDSTLIQPFDIVPVTIIQYGIVRKLTCSVTQVSFLNEIYTEPGVYQVETSPCIYAVFMIWQDIQPKSITLSPVSLCPGECFTFHGQMICPQSGDTPPSAVLTGANGCDSTVTQPFVFQAPDTVQLGQVAVLNCAVTSVAFHGVTYTQPGVYALHVDLCTVEQFSIAQDIQSPPPTVLAPVNLCPGECFTFNGQMVCPQAGDTPPSMLLTAANGCDSTVTQPFVFQAPDTVQLGQVAVLNCAVTSVAFHGATYTQPGVYALQVDPCTVEQFSIAQDIQSPPPTILAPVNLCPGECFMFNGQMVCPQAGETPPSMLLTAANGCDSTVTQPFVFQAPDTVQLGQVAMLNCAVTSVAFHGATYTQPGVYALQIDPCTVEQFSIAQDVQSPPPTVLAPVNLCPGECFTFNGQMVCPQAGETPPSMLLTATNGCDSTVTQPFAFQAPDTVQLGQVAVLNCAVTSVAFHGAMYTQPGVYALQVDPCTVEQFSIGHQPAPALTILQPVQICPGECIPWDGVQFCPQAGDPPLRQLLLSALGCDSVIEQPIIWNLPDTISMGVVATLSCRDTAFVMSGTSYSQPGVYVQQLDPCTFERFEIAENPEKCLSVYVPNVIQADGGGNNAWFTLYTNLDAGVQINYLRIFDRWGNQVFLNTHFSPNVPDLGWNGSLGGQRCMPGVYVYVYELLLPDGGTQVKSGDVTIVR